MLKYSLWSNIMYHLKTRQTKAFLEKIVFPTSVSLVSLSCFLFPLLNLFYPLTSGRAWLVGAFLSSHQGEFLSPEDPGPLATYDTLGTGVGQSISDYRKATILLLF